MKPEWRPDDWVNPHGKGDWIGDLPHEAYEAGASAMLSALLKWLDEPCNCLDHAQIVEFAIDVKGMYPHRKDCPQCWKELRGEK